MAKSPRRERAGEPRTQTPPPATGRRPSFPFLIFTVLCSGAGIMMLEILGARIAGPVFGVSLYIWTALIAVTLLALSVGYWLGGLLCDRRPQADVMYGLILLAGVLIAFIPWADGPVLEACYRAFRGDWGVRLGVLVASFILFAPPLTLLGMVSPYAIKLALADLRRAGKTAGSLYAVSTVGSVAGTIVVGYVLIPGVGVTRTLLVITALILAPPAIWFTLGRRWEIIGAGGLALALGAVSAWAAPSKPLPANTIVVAARDSLYGHVKIVDMIYPSGALRWMLVDGAAQTGIRRGSDELLSNYTQRIMDFLHVHPPPGRRVLLAGMGGGALLRALYAADYEVDVVEIDPLVAKWAVQYFDCDPGRYRLIREDGRGYIRRAEAVYDAIIFDVYSGSAQPFHFYSRESFEDARRVLAPGGLLALNSISFPGGPESALPASLHRTASSALPHSRIILAHPNDPEDQLNNILMFFSDTPFAQPDDPPAGDDPAWERLRDGRIEFGPDEGILITDDFNPVDRWTARVNEAWRQRIFRDMGPALLAY